MRHALPLAVALLALSACNGTHKGTETGNPNMVAARIASAAWSSDPALVSTGPGGAIQVDRAWVWVSELDFETACTDGTDEEEGDETDATPTLVELIGQASLSRKLDRTKHCRVDLALDSPADAPTTAPTGLDAATLILEGTLDDGRVWRVRSDESLDIRLEGDFAVDVGGADFALGFDLAGWFDGIDLGALPEEDGVLVLDDEESQDLDQFNANFTQSVGLYADLNANGVLDPTDTSEPPLAQPEN